MKRTAFVVMVLLAGCATPQEKAAQEAQAQAAQQEAYRQQVFGQCRSYGIAEGTEEFRRCLMQVDMAYRAQNDAQRQMLLQQYLLQQGTFRR
jgi:hypothetical protein